MLRVFLLRFKQWQWVLIWFISLLESYPAYSEPSLDSLSSHSAEIQQELASLNPKQRALQNLDPPTSTNSSKILAELQQVQADLERTPPLAQPTTKAAFGLGHFSRNAATLRLSPRSSQVAFAASKLKALEPGDFEMPLLEPEGDRPKLPKSTAMDSLLAADPDLGNLRLQESSERPVFPGSPSDPNSPFAPPVPSGCDPELGCLRLQIPTATATSAPVMYLLPRLDVFRSNNILSGLNPVQDGLLRPAISLLVLPALGSSTYLNASAEGALNQYFSLTQFNYSEIKLKAGIFQRLLPSMSAEIGWTNQQFFISGNQIAGLSAGTRFLNDHSIRFELSRQDQLAKNLSLNSFYQFRISFTEPRDRSRIINVLSLSLNYGLTPRVQLGLDYQFAAANFTVQPRTDLYHQVLGRISYSAFRNTQISLYGGISTGTSTESAINFNSFLLGISVSLSLVIF